MSNTPTGRGQVVTAHISRGEPRRPQNCTDCYCECHDDAPLPAGTYVTIHLAEDQAVGVGGHVRIEEDPSEDIYTTANLERAARVHADASSEYSSGCERRGWHVFAQTMTMPAGKPVCSECGFAEAGPEAQTDALPENRGAVIRVTEFNGVRLPWTVYASRKGCRWVTLDGTDWPGVGQEAADAEITGWYPINLVPSEGAS